MESIGSNTYKADLLGDSLVGASAGIVAMRYSVTATLSLHYAFFLSFFPSYCALPIFFFTVVPFSNSIFLFVCVRLLGVFRRGIDGRVEKRSLKYNPKRKKKECGERVTWWRT